MLGDTRNVLNEFKGKDGSDIVDELDRRTCGLEIACENTLRDFNMGSIVRTANAFGVRHVHVVGRRQWNRRGAMATDTYLHVHYHPTIEAFISAMRDRSVPVIAIENNRTSDSLQRAELPEQVCLVFGQEGPGLSDEFIAACDQVLHIDQYGSTRSINVGHAAAVAMYEWSRQHR
jgi:tRNA G18 (ribose-2'-O)-methylase SpoU